MIFGAKSIKKSSSISPGATCIRCLEVHAQHKLSMPYQNKKTGQKIVANFELCDLCAWLYGCDKRTYDIVNERALLKLMKRGDLD